MNHYVIRTIYMVFLSFILITTFSNPAWGANYNYDDLNRLIKVNYGDGQEVNYSYDAGGNITTVDVTGVDPLYTDILLEGTEGNEEWYRSDVKVILTAHNNIGGTGTGSTLYSFNGENWADYLEPLTISTEGINKIYYRSISSGGTQEAVKEKDIKIDKTPPY